MFWVFYAFFFAVEKLVSQRFSIEYFQRLPDNFFGEQLIWRILRWKISSSIESSNVHFSAILEEDSS